MKLAKTSLAILVPGLLLGLAPQGCATAEELDAETLAEIRMGALTRVPVETPPLQPASSVTPATSGISSVLPTSAEPSAPTPDPPQQTPVATPAAEVPVAPMPVDPAAPTPGADPAAPADPGATPAPDAPGIPEAPLPGDMPVDPAAGSGGTPGVPPAQATGATPAVEPVDPIGTGAVAGEPVAEPDPESMLDPELVAAIREQTQLEVYYTANDKNQNLSLRIQIRSLAPMAVPLAELELRYYYTSEDIPFEYVVDDTNLMFDAEHIDAADGTEYISVTWDGGSLSLGGSGTQIAIRTEVYEPPQYDQTNDYSFSATSTVDGAAYENITVYRRGILVWGTPPP
jgi:hypothetical protein